MWDQPRDPARIERITEKLARAWALYPDFRLGQLIVNLGDPKPFAIPDHVLERRLDEFLANPPYTVELLDGAPVYTQNPGEHQQFVNRTVFELSAAAGGNGPYPDDPRSDQVAD